LAYRQHVRPIIGEVVVDEKHDPVSAAKAESRAGPDCSVHRLGGCGEIVSGVAAHLGRDDAKAAAETAAARRLQQACFQIDPAAFKQTIIYRVVANPSDCRAIDRLKRPTRREVG
jgi:hypothetical protein